MSGNGRRTVFAKIRARRHTPPIRGAILMQIGTVAGTLALVNALFTHGAVQAQAYPVKPQLLDKRSSYVEGIYNFGVEWTY